MSTLPHEGAAPSIDHFFVVGPVAILHGKHRRGSLSILLDIDRAGSREGFIGCEVSGRQAFICHKALRGIDSEFLVEVIRLFIRVVKCHFAELIDMVTLKDAELLPQSALAELARLDGFSQSADGQTWSRIGNIIIAPRNPVHVMDDLYQDPYAVPWNFVPLELDVILPLLRWAKSGAKILDLGCGFGKNAQFLTGSGCRVSCFDISPEAVARARSILPKNCTVVTASVEAIPWKDNYFDAVLDVGCLHCVPSAVHAAAIREIFRVLSPNGRLYSRIFRVRQSGWMAKPLCGSETLGLEPKAATALMRVDFPDVSVRVDGNSSYLVAKKLN